jgi:predicted nucleic acid-binding protein
VDFTADDSAGTARLFNLAGRRRGSFTDCMIAAVALRVGASMATANPDDFGDFEAVGLEIVRA